MRLIRRARDVQAFDRAVTASAAPSFMALVACPYGRRYFTALLPADAVDHAFAIVDDAGAAVHIDCQQVGATLSNFGFPLEIRLRPDLALPIRNRLTRDALAEIQRLVAAHAIAACEIRTAPALDPGGLVTSSLCRSSPHRLEIRTTVDLSLDEAALAEDLRKGHRQQLKWGRANLAFTTVDRARPDARAFDLFREFHAEVAGRVTRQRASWDVMREMVEAGDGALVLGRLDGALVAGSLCLDAGGTTYYASGVYDRRHFDKPLSHASVFLSILEAKARGMQRFDVGHVPEAGSNFPEKEISIGNFKHGFASATDTSILWSVGLAPPVGHQTAD